MAASRAGEGPKPNRNPSRRRSAAILAALAFLLSAPLAIGGTLAAIGAAGFDEQGNAAFAAVCGIAAALCIVWWFVSQNNTRVNRTLTGTARCIVVFLILGTAAMSKLAAVSFVSLAEGEPLGGTAGFLLLSLFILIYSGTFAVCSLSSAKSLILVSSPTATPAGEGQ